MLVVSRRQPAAAFICFLVILLAGCDADAATHTKRGDERFQQKDFPGAIEEYKAAERLAPHDSLVTERLGFSYNAIGDRRNAIEYLERARVAAPLDTSIRLTLGSLYLADGRADDAGKEASAILDKAPSNLAALNLAGSAYIEKNEPGKALDLYRKVVELAPTDPRSEYLLGTGLMARGNSADAVKHFESALAISPAYLDPLTQIVALDLAAQRSGAAVERVKKQIAAVGDSARLNELLALAYISGGDRERAESTLLKVIRIEPRYLDPYVRLSELYRAWGKYDQAIEIAEKGLVLDPNNLSLRFVQGATFEARGDKVHAEHAYAEALRINPKFAAAANNLASLLAESGTQLDRALAIITMASQSEPDNPAIADTFGWVLFKRGDYGGAIAHLNQAAAKLPEEPTVAYHLGMANAKAGDTASARRALDRALASRAPFPDKEAARKALAALR
jgi:tetratricopeptide (TPR) repeat protein